MKYLLGTTEVYRLDSESEANALVEEAKQEGNLSKQSGVHNERKTKGEGVDEWHRVTLTKTFTDEKEPDQSVLISYEVE